MNKINTHTNKEVQNKHHPRWKNIVLWILQVVFAVMFIMAGGSKIFGVPDMIELFENIGFGQWFRYLTGIMEIIAGILLLIPSVSVIGALLLVCVMAGAIFTHLLLIGGSIVMPLVYLVLSLIILWGRWYQVNPYLSITDKVS